MTSISPKVLCQHSFFYLPHHARICVKTYRFFIGETLPPVTQKFLPHRPQFVDRPSLSIVGFLQVASRILDQVEHAFDSRFHRRVPFQPPLQLVIT